jgi:hypothetical protein
MKRNNAKVPIFKRNEKRDTYFAFFSLKIIDLLCFNAKTTLVEEKQKRHKDFDACLAKRSENVFSLELSNRKRNGPHFASFQFESKF